MMRTALLMAAAAALVCCKAPRSQAQTYGDAPWCAVISIGTGEVQWDCEYWSAEACAPDVAAGNRGYCNMNPYWKGPYPGERSTPSKYPRHGARRRY
jgi:Protein of unknown function (DUF3551)